VGTQTAGAGEFHYVSVLDETAVLPEDFAAAPVDSGGITTGTRPDTIWAALCFDGNGRLIARDAALSPVRLTGTLPGATAPPLPPPMGTSRGVKLYKPSVLLAEFGEEQLADVDPDDLTDFLNRTDDPSLWHAVVLNQFSGQPLAME